ncbi:MAG: protein translocase subunit SecF [Gammaproteobacteria bacterium]
MNTTKRSMAFDFMSKRKVAMALSITLVTISIFSVFARGLNLGIDFTGGTLIELGFEKTVAPSVVRDVLSESGFEDAIVQQFGTSKELLIRIAPRDEMSSAEVSTKVLNVVHGAYPDEVDLRRVEFVGPQVGDELTEDGGIAMLIALGAIFIYVGFLRFEKRFAVGSVVALMHDVILTLGFFSLLQLEFDLTVLAAVLAVIGYSLNDTIVVFDRIRENFRKMRKGTPIEIMNRSINQTLSRTIITSLTTLLVLIALFVLGGEIIHGFATALIFGIVVGTYSSIFVASTTTLALGVSKVDLMPVEKEGKEIDARP